MSLLQLEGYNCIYQKGTCRRKGGLVIYLKEEFEYVVKMNCNTSDIWEGLFIEVWGQPIDKKIIIGNVYRPPSELVANYENFQEELSPILQTLHSSRQEVVLAGDYNIDLLKVNLKSKVADIFDHLVTNSFFLKLYFLLAFQKGTELSSTTFFVSYPQNHLIQNQAY